MKLLKYIFFIVTVFFFSSCIREDKYIEDTNQKVFIVADQNNASGVGNAEKSVFMPNKELFEYNSLIDSLQVLKDPVGQKDNNFQAAQAGSFIPALAYAYSGLTNNKVIVIQSAKGGSALTLKVEINN